MDIQGFLQLVKLAENLKNNPRHSWTSTGRRESVAEHSWRLCFMAYFVKDEFPGIDMEKLLKMCVFHDIGEAFTGDIPAFQKTSEDSQVELNQVELWIKQLPEPYREELGTLFEEMEAQQTEEARVYKALDKMEALISHNEADISTWLPLEYNLQLSYGKDNVQFSEYMKQLKGEIDEWSLKKIREEGSGDGKTE